MSSTTKQEDHLQREKYLTVDWWGRKVGLIGLVEKEWLDTLSTINPEEVTYTDFVDAGTMLARELKKNKNCEIVIALTHMRSLMI